MNTPSPRVLQKPIWMKNVTASLQSPNQSLKKKLLAANKKIASLQKSLCVTEKYGNYLNKY